KHFPIKNSVPFKKSRQSVKAVDGLDFFVYPGETFGVVGESGCGKSTMARLINQLIRPSSGHVLFKGDNLVGMNSEQLRTTRKSIQMVFQDPFASLDPRKTVGELIAEPLVIHKVGDKHSRQRRVKELLEVVGLESHHAERLPHEFSGGQRQRVNIARTLALNPEVVICDEPVSALDVSVQAQVINLLKKLQRQFDLTYIFISHDLNVVRYMCDRIAVMYLGKIVEMGTYEEIYDHPKHPYTQALLSAIPKESPDEKKEQIILKGSVPSPINPPSGCPFHERCPFAMDMCKTNTPDLQDVGGGHIASCHLVDQNNYEEYEMSFKYVMDVYELLDSYHVTGAEVKDYLDPLATDADIQVQTVEGDQGSTDFIKVTIQGENGKSKGGDAPTLGIVGRLGGIGARPEMKGFVSDGDGALSCISAAAKLLDMTGKGDRLNGDVILTTHICPTAPTLPHDPVPFMNSPVDILTMNQYEVTEEMDAILSIDTTKGNMIINHKGFAITPTVKEGYILKVSNDLLHIYTQSAGILPVPMPITTQDITPCGNDVHHVNSILQPAVATASPVVGVAITAQSTVAGCATGGTHLDSVESVVRFVIEVAKYYGEHKCEFFNGDEFNH